VLRGIPKSAAARERLPSAFSSASTSRPRSSRETASFNEGGSSGAAVTADVFGKTEHRGRHARAVGQEGDALHHVRQLAHVSGPGLIAQGRASVRGQRLGRPPVFGAGPREEVLGQDHDVFAALAQGRQAQRDHGQPMVEVLAHAASAQGRAQVLAGGGDHPDVDRLVARAAQPPHRPLLDRLQQLALQGDGQEPDLVEEQRAPVRGLEEAGLGLLGVGERALLVAEQLRFEEGLGDGGAVDVDEGPARARPAAVQHPCEETLARPGLPFNKDRGQAAGGHALEQALHLLAHRR
jgi:hypothetical protein